MGKFLVALIKATFVAWVSLFTVVALGVSMLFAGLESAGVIYNYGAYHQPSKDIFQATMAFFTALIFAYVFARHYGFTISGFMAEKYQNLRMKWDLRGIGKD